LSQPLLRMRIQELKIYSSNIKEQADFYSKTLGLEIVDQNNQSVFLRLGNSILQIAYRSSTTPYHFAINIPANKDIEALEWTKTRVTLLKDGMKEIHDFDSWNSRAIYFYDQDRNIVELIARKNLNNASDQKFNSGQFLGISEIGLPTQNIEKEFEQLNRLTNIGIYDGTFERFCAIGDEHGLFICINKNVKDWFPTNDKAYSSDFGIKLIEKGKTYEIEYKNEKLRAIASRA